MYLPINFTNGTIQVSSVKMRKCHGERVDVASGRQRILLPVDVVNSQGKVSKKCELIQLASQYLIREAKN